MQAGKVTPKVVMSSAPTERESAHRLHSHIQTPWQTSLRGPQHGCPPGSPDLTASQNLHFVPHKRQPPPFCASPPSQKANPSILCFPSLIDSSLHHFVPPLPHMKQPPLFSASKESAPSILCLPSLTGGSCLPQARYQEGLQP